MKDPAGVSALLAKLRESQAWSEIQASGSGRNTTQDSSNQKSTVEELTESKPTPTGPSVAELLSQLSSTATSSTATAPVDSLGRSSEAFTAPDHSLHGFSRSSPHAFLPQEKEMTSQNQRNVISSRANDIRALSFQQSLLNIAQLSEDASFLDAITKVS